MVSGSQLQVAKLAKICPAVPNGAQLQPRSKPLGQNLTRGAQRHPTTLNGANQSFFRAHHPFYVLFKKNSNPDPNSASFYVRLKKGGL